MSKLCWKHIEYYKIIKMKIIKTMKEPGGMSMIQGKGEIQKT